MPLSFEMPPRLTSSPKPAPIYHVEHPIFLNHSENLYAYKNPKPYLDVLTNGYSPSGYQLKVKMDPKPFESIQQSWQNRLHKLGLLFKITGEKQQLETMDRLVLHNENLQIHVYKASNSFLYLNRNLASPTNPIYTKILMKEKDAYDRAEEILTEFKLRDGDPEFVGIGYTCVSVDRSTFGEDPPSSSKEYKTEIKVYYRYKLNGLPIFGPGAKIVVSFVGQELSQLVYFSRTPKGTDFGNFESSKINLHRPLISQEEALHHFSHDNRFTKLKKSNAKVRFHDIQLGYYARSPQEIQRFMYPTYQVKGTLETWQKIKNGYPDLQEQVSGDVFRYHFAKHMLAVSDPNVEEKKMFAPHGKGVSTF